MTFVVFDLDDTLYLERDFAFSGYAAVSAETGFPGFEQACLDAFARGQRSRIFDTALASLGHAPDPDLIARMIHVYRAHRPRIHLAADARRAVARWSGRAGLITDGPARMQRNKVRALGLCDHLDPIVLTGALGPDAGKPSPVAFEVIERAMGLSGRSLSYVADNPLKDFITPRRRGWQTIMIARPDRIHTAPAPTPDHLPAFSIVSLDLLESCLEGETAAS